MRSERHLWWPGCSAANWPVLGANGFWPSNSASMRSTTWTQSPAPSATPVPPSRSGSMPTVWAGSKSCSRMAVPNPGRADSVGPEARQALEEGLKVGRWRTAPQMHADLSRDFGITLKLGSLYNRLRKAGARLRLSRPRHECSGTIILHPLVASRENFGIIFDKNGIKISRT